MVTRRKFLGGLGLATAGAALAPLVRTRRAHAAAIATQRIVFVAIGGGLRRHESLGMQWGATMPNLFGNVPLIPGFGSGPKGPPQIADEYEAMVPPLALGAQRATPLVDQAALVTNIRYAEGAPGHLQGQACLVSGYYNNIENRADARLPVPTIFEIHRRARNAPSTDAWYLTVPGGFYRALMCSDAPGYGARYGVSYLQPPAVMSPIVSLVASNTRTIDVGGGYTLPTIPHDAAEDAAVRRLTAMLDGNTAPYGEDGIVRASAGENAAVEDHLGTVFADDSYQAFFPDSFGIGLRDGTNVVSTPDALTVYHAEQILAKFKPSLMSITLLDIDQCHENFNEYLRAQQLADALVNHLWNAIQGNPDLRDTTTLVVMPEHGRHLFYNGRNPDSLGRSGIDHGVGDDGDRDVWMMVIGPDVLPGVIAPTGITQPDRTSGRYESIDAVMTAMTLLGHGDALTQALTDGGARPGLVVQEIMR